MSTSCVLTAAGRSRSSCSSITGPGLDVGSKQTMARIAGWATSVAAHDRLCTTADPDSPHLVVPSYTGSLYLGFGSADTLQPASTNAALIEGANAWPRKRPRSTTVDLGRAVSIVVGGRPLGWVGRMAACCT